MTVFNNAVNVLRQAEEAAKQGDIEKAHALAHIGHAWALLYGGDQRT